MEISGNEDTTLSSHTICSMYLITYSGADTTPVNVLLMLLSLILRMELPPKFCDAFTHLSHTRLTVSIPTLQLTWTTLAVGLQ